MTGRDCPACGVPFEVALRDVEDSKSGERFAVLRCPACGLGATDPIPEDLGRYYDAGYYGQRHGFTARYRSWRRLRLLQRESAAAGALLDVGCGDGNFLGAARRAGWRVRGVERGPALDTLRACGMTAHGDLDEIEDGTRFRVITFWHSFEHLARPAETLRRVAPLLETGGLLVVAVPDWSGIQAQMFGRSWFHLDVPRHLFHYSQAGMRRLLAQQGLTIVRIDHHEIEYDLFGWLQSALNATLPVRNLFFDWLTGKVRGRHRLQIAVAALVTVLLGPLAVLATLLASLMGAGATLVVVARKLPAPPPPAP